MARDDVIRDLRQAAQRRIDVEDEVEAMRAEAIDALVAAIRRCQAEGVSVPEIADELGVTRQRVYALLGRS